MLRCPVPVNDPEVRNYIEYLERKEDRLNAIETRLDSIGSSTMHNRDNFLREFRDLPPEPLLSVPELQKLAWKHEA